MTKVASPESLEITRHTNTARSETEETEFGMGSDKVPLLANDRVIAARAFVKADEKALLLHGYQNLRATITQSVVPEDHTQCSN
jgi:hypothetical protein